MFKKIAAALTALALSTGTVSAATVEGSFSVFAINVAGILDKAQSAATVDNFNDAFGKASSGDAGYSFDSFSYTGALDFGTSDPNDGTTISQWLATGTPGGVSGLDTTFGDLQLSAPSISKGTATTTFFVFGDLGNSFTAGDLTLQHDDGVLAGSFFNTPGGIGVSDTWAAFAGPNGERTTTGFYDGTGFFDVLYVATNGDPSVLSVDLAAVPLPAGLPLMLLGLGSIAALRRRNQAA